MNETTNGPIEAIVTGATYYQTSHAYMLTAHKVHTVYGDGFGSAIMKVYASANDIATYTRDWKWGTRVKVWLNEVPSKTGAMPTYELIRAEVLA